MVRFNRHTRPAVKGYGLNHIRIERALREKFCVFDLLGLGVENIDESRADDFTFTLWIAHPFQLVEEGIFGVHMDEVNLIMFLKQIDDLIALALTHHARIHIDTGQLITNRFMDEYRRHRAIHPAAKPANHMTIANLRADSSNGFVLKGGHRPVALKACNLMGKVT